MKKRLNSIGCKCNKRANDIMAITWESPVYAFMRQLRPFYFLLQVLLCQKPAVHFNKCIFIGSTNFRYGSCYGETLILLSLCNTQVADNKCIRKNPSILLSAYSSLALQFSFWYTVIGVAIAATNLSAHTHTHIFISSSTVSFETSPHSFIHLLPR